MHPWTPPDGLDLDRALGLAVEVCRQAGDLAVVQRLGARVESKSGTDLVTQVDRAAEQLIATAILDAYPSHAILGEEGGSLTDSVSPWQWLIDPLDGTHNYVLGLPLYGVCLTLCHLNEPVLAVVHDSPHHRTRWAITGRGSQGAKVGEQPVELRISAPEDLARTTVAVAKGYSTPDDDPQYRRTLHTLDKHTKRVVRHWAPSVDWGLLVEGTLGALVIYANEGPWDVAGGRLLAVEAGASAWESHDSTVEIVGRPATVTALVELLGLPAAPPRQN